MYTHTHHYVNHLYRLCHVYWGEVECCSRFAGRARDCFEGGWRFQVDFAGNGEIVGREGAYTKEDAFSSGFRLTVSGRRGDGVPVMKSMCAPSFYILRTGDGSASFVIQRLFCDARGGREMFIFGNSGTGWIEERCCAFLSGTPTAPHENTTQTARTTHRLHTLHLTLLYTTLHGRRTAAAMGDRRHGRLRQEKSVTAKR